MTLATKLPSQSELRKAFSYDPETGEFRRLIERGGIRAKNGVAGTARRNNYVSINYLNKRYAAHRLAVIYMLGDGALDAATLVDHVNHDTRDNRWCNLRVCTQSQNIVHTRSSRGRIPIRGVQYNAKRGRYFAICYRADGSGKAVSSYHKTLEEAVAARRKYEIQLHGEFACAS